MKKSPSLLLIAIAVSAIAQTAALSTQAGVPREQTNARNSAQEETAPANPEAKTACSCNNCGVDKLVLGDIAGAISDFSEAIGMDPSFAPAWNNRGNARLAAGDLQLAIADYTRAITLDPYDAPAYHNRARAREASGDAKGAVADYSRAAELSQKLAPPAAA